VGFLRLLKSRLLVDIDASWLDVQIVNIFLLAGEAFFEISPRLGRDWSDVPRAVPVRILRQETILSINLNNAARNIFILHRRNRQSLRLQGQLHVLCFNHLVLAAELGQV